MQLPRRELDLRGLLCGEGKGSRKGKGKKQGTKKETDGRKTSHEIDF